MSDEEPIEIVVCQGPPRCWLQGDEAAEAARSGCAWCERITIHGDGTETHTGPGSA